MINLIDKLTSYNLFNYLFPGVIFATLSEKFTSYSFLQNDVVVGFFVYYFIGLLISRFGSLLLEPLLKKINFLKFAPYSDFVAASRHDPKIELFSEINNMYRTISSLFILLIFLKFYEHLESNYTLNNFYALTFGFLIVFLFSYRKQTKYITKRIDEKK